MRPPAEAIRSREAAEPSNPPPIIPVDQGPSAANFSSDELGPTRVLRSRIFEKSTRRAWLRSSLGLTACGLTARPAAALFRAAEIQHIALNVPDLTRSREFYRRVVAARVIEETETSCFLGLRRNYVALFRGEPAGMNHFAIAVEDFDAAEAARKLKDGGYRPYQRAAGVWAIRDPDGLEVHPCARDHRRQQVTAAYEADPKPEALFHAADVNHVALRVRDVGRSRDFYQAVFGLPVARQSGNSCFLSVGRNFLALFQGRGPGAMDHYCLSIEEYEVAAVVAKLQRHGLNPRREASRVYFPDPDGLTVQFAAENHGP